MKKSKKKAYGNGGAISPDDNDYNTFVKTLPSNLRNTDTSTYNLRGYWEALGKPSQFDYSQPKESDGYYHAFSRNPQTGEILKKENHPTFRMAIEGDMQAGYSPYRDKTTGKIYTFNEKPDMSKFEVYNTAPLYDNLYLAHGGPIAYSDGGVIDDTYTDPLAIEGLSVPRVSYGNGGSILNNYTTRDLNNFLYSNDAWKESSELSSKARKVNTCAGGNCAQGAFDWSANYISPYLQIPATRASLQKAVPNIKDTEFSMMSNSYNKENEYLHNRSIDSWELYNIYKDTDAGTVFWDKKKQGQFEATPENWKNIPVGAVITQGEAKGRKTHPSHGSQSSHTTTVVGFDKTGHPLVYDNGTIQQLGKSRWRGYTINDIFIPKGYDDFTYSNIQQRIKDHTAELGYKDEAGNLLPNNPNNYSRFYVNDIKNSLDENEAAIGNHYNIPKEFMDKIQNRVIGLGAKESNFNEFGDQDTAVLTKAETQLGDNEAANLVAKPALKAVTNFVETLWDSAFDLFDDREQLEDWEVEVMLASKLEEEGMDVPYGSDEWNAAYNQLREKYDEKSTSLSGIQKSSRGPYKIKNFPKTATKLLKDSEGEPLEEGDLTLVGDDVDELRHGANVATIHLIENIKRLKKRYADKNLTDDQLLDLATIAYNNQSKSLSPEFVDNYIKKNYLKDGYLEDVKRLQNLYLEQTPPANTVAQNAYGGVIKNTDMQNMDFNTYVALINAQRQQMDKGGTILSKTGAGLAGVGKGIAGSLLPGPIGTAVNQGIDTLHGMLDKNISDEERALMGWGQAAGAVGTAIATGGATIGAGMDDFAAGLGEGIAHGTEIGRSQRGANQAGIKTLSNIAGTIGGAAYGAAGKPTGTEGMNASMSEGPGAGIAQTPTAVTDTATSLGNPGQNIMTSPQQAGTTDLGDMGNIQQTFNTGAAFTMPTASTAWGVPSAYGGMLPMAQGGFKPHPMYKDGETVMANDYETHLRLKEQGYGHEQMKGGGMIKRADGSYSQRGLWDNIRANKGSGKEPTAEMLKQERRIKNMANGGLMSIENGGTHEQNPMGGVPVGPTASVEEGETIMDLVEGGKFVFTDRDGPKGKKGKTFADISKQIEKKYKDREGDAAAERAMNQELVMLAKNQEERKAAKMAKLQAQMDELNPQAAAPQAPMQAPMQVPMIDPSMMQQPQPMMPQMGYGGKTMYNMGGPMMVPGQNPMMGQPAVQQMPMNTMPNQMGYGGRVLYQHGGLHSDSLSQNFYTALGMDSASKAQVAAELDQRRAQMAGNNIDTVSMGQGNPVQNAPVQGNSQIPAADLEYIDQIIDFELAHGSQDGTGLSYGAWSKNQASDRESARKFIYDTYVVPNQDLPIELRKRAVDMHLNSEDPRASLMVAAGLISPSEKGKIYKNKAEVTKLMTKDLGHKPTAAEYAANRNKYLGLQEDRLNAAWDKHKDKVIAKYNDPAFVQAFDKEKHRSYKGNNNSAGMYGKSHKYRIDMWNPQAANYKNPVDYKNVDYSGGQPNIGTAQFESKAAVQSTPATSNVTDNNVTAFSNVNNTGNVNPVTSPATTSAPGTGPASPWDNLFDNLEGLTKAEMKQIARDNNLPWEDLATEAAKRGYDLGDIGDVGVDNIDSFGSKTFAGLQRAYNTKKALDSATDTTANVANSTTVADDGTDTSTTAEKTPEQLAAEKAAREQEALELAMQQRRDARNRNAMIGLGAMSNSLGDLYNLYQGIRGPEDINLDRLTPDRINLDEQRAIARDNAAASQAVQRENIRATAPSSGAALSGMVAGTSAIDQNLGNILRQSAVDEETINTQMANQANQFNVGVGNKEKELNMMASARAQDAIQEGLHGIGAGTAGALKDMRMSNQVDRLNADQLNALNAIFSNYAFDANRRLSHKDGTVVTQADLDAALAKLNKK